MNQILKSVMIPASEAKLKLLLFTTWKRYLPSRRAFISSPFSEFKLKKERVHSSQNQPLAFNNKVALVTGAGLGELVGVRILSIERIIFLGSDRSSRSHNVCLSVCPAQVCLEQSIFIFLGQRAIREH